MEKIKNNFIQHPTRKNLFVFTSLWLLGTSLLVLSMTDLFTESFFQKGYSGIYLILISSTTFLSKLYINYWKTSKIKF